MKNSSEQPAVPAGYRLDRQGRLVAEANIKPIDRTRDELVLEIVGRAKELSAELAKFKARTFDDVAAFVSLSAEQYGVQLGGTKGNVTLMSFDGRFKLVRQIQELIRFDERLQAAKELIDDCLQEWSEGAREELKVLVTDAFRVDQQGNIRTGQVLGLRRLDIKDERWLEAMKAVAEAVQVVGTTSYVRIYERDDLGRYQPINLALSEV